MSPTPPGGREEAGAEKEWKKGSCGGIQEGDSANLPFYRGR